MKTRAYRELKYIYIAIESNSPYNQYRINDEPRGRRASKYHGKHRFLKFVFVVAVLAVAYAALAYFIKGLPGDDTIRNLVNRFIEIIK